MTADNQATFEQNVRDGQGVYIKVPVIAYNLLGDLRQHRAQRILVGLCSYMDYNTKISWPSYKKLAKRTGVSPNGIRASLDLLERLGFLKITKRATGGIRMSNQYEVRKHAYLPHLWERQIAQHLPKVGRCLDCANHVNLAQYATGPRGKHVHFGCGGRVVLFTAPIQPDAPTFDTPPV